MTKLYAPLILILTFLCVPPAVAGDLKSDLIANEKASWTAWGKKDAQVFASFMDKDYRSVAANGAPLVGKDANVKDLANSCELHSLAFEDVTMRQLGADVAVVGYTAAVDSTCEGKRAAYKAAVTSVWNQQNGKWINTHYHESVIN